MERHSRVPECLEASIYAEGPAGHMLDLPRDVIAEAGLVLGQHLQHQTQVQPPLCLRHPVSRPRR